MSKWRKKTSYLKCHAANLPEQSSVKVYSVQSFFNQDVVKHLPFGLFEPPISLSQADTPPELS